MHQVSSKRAFIALFYYLIIRFGFIFDVAKAKIAYPKGCSNKPSTYYDYDNYPSPPPSNIIRSRDDFQLLKRLGAGKFSDVFEAVDVTHNSTKNTKSSDAIPDEALVAIKCLKPVSERKIKRELLVLSHVSSLPNLARFIGVCWDDNSLSGDRPNSMPAIILQHAGRNTHWFSHGAGHANNKNDPRVLSKKSSEASINRPASYYLSEYEIKYFIFQLLLALDALHSHGIMHRDVKPRNILINRGNIDTSPDGQREECIKHGGEEEKESSLPTSEMIRRATSSLLQSLKRPLDTAEIDTKAGERSLMLIDLGLADFYLPGQRYNVRVASRHYKAPELLFGYDLYNYSMDLWSVGCILGGLLLRREPMFKGKNNVDQLSKIVSILGTEDLIAYCEKYSIQLTQEMVDAIGHHRPKKTWNQLCNGEDCPAPSHTAMQLLDRLLMYDQDQRFTAAEAMKHSFFDDVRKEILRK